MDLNKFGKEVHQNAIDHGFWDNEEITILELVALINSEWSEALQEYRNNRGMVWYNGKKPEGIAVELIDGCLRILDLYASVGAKTLSLEDGMKGIPKNVYTMKLPDLVATLTYEVSKTTEVVLKNSSDEEFCQSVVGMANALFIALKWVEHKGCNPEKLLREKHEYNKTRPYRHGGKVC